MNSASQDIVDILVDESSLGLTLLTDLFGNRMPNDPIDCTVVYDLPGGPPMLALRKAFSDYYYSSISVQVRNSSYSNGYSLIHDIFKYLHGLHGIPKNATQYHLIKAMDDPSILRYDENDRPIFVVNFEIQRSVGIGFTKGFSLGFRA